jgi:UDP-3-O-acyl-N-acetylglucosamine deacetylase
MHAMGLFEHLTPRDMLVFGADGPIDNELRFEDEPARHKLLDLIGDLSLAGRPVLGRVVAERSGHALTHEAVRRLLAGA